MTNEKLSAYAAGANCPHVDVMAMAEELLQLRGNLSLAEEGLASATQEIEQLRKINAGMIQGLKDADAEARGAHEPEALQPIFTVCGACQRKATVTSQSEVKLLGIICERPDCPGRPSQKS